MNSGGTPAVTSSFRREPRACSQVSRSSGVRTTSTCGAPGSPPVPVFGVLLFLSCGRRGGAGGQHVHRGLVRGQHRLGRQRRAHRRIEPGLLQPPGQPGAGLVHPPGGHGNTQEHVHDVRGAFRRHVPVRGQHDRGGVQRRPVGHRPGVRAGRRGRDRGGPAARALTGPAAPTPSPFSVTCTSTTCAHPGAAGAAPARPVPQRRHCAGGSASLRSPGSGSRASPRPRWPGCPPRRRSFLRSRSDS